ncbi:MAG: 50S ribosomal protein L11 methyltransferase [Pseudomonadales bacterium]|nr:50S ribosomal protein L11 methyltransferase [Pseudomonadales bacterium]
MLAKFNKILQQQIPGASIKFQTLPRADCIKLALLDPDFDDRNLSTACREMIMDDPPYWIFCWASGHALAELMLKGSIDVKGKVVLDFGAGSGVGAIAAKMAGASKVIACDIDPLSLQLIEANALENSVELSIVNDLDRVGPVDLLIAADVLYESANYRFLDQFLNLAPEIVIADSRLKKMPNDKYAWWNTINTTSFPDFSEALEFNEVKFYRNIVSPSDIR